MLPPVEKPGSGYASPGVIRKLLAAAAGHLQHIAQDEAILAETPREVQDAMESAAESIGQALRRLEWICHDRNPTAIIPGGPTRQQGQFLAFIREYMIRNYAGVAPTHAEFQRFFNLTAPSVNSMLIRLEQRGFIRRVPRKARAIELSTDPAWIPPLDRPFKF